MKENKKQGIKFYHKSHKYKYGKDELTSVTRFISKFFPEFEAKELAKKLASFPWAKKQGKTMRTFLKEWKETAEVGTKIHEYMENYCKNTMQECDFEEILANKEYKVQRGIEWLDKFLESKKKYILLPEALVYDIPNKLAGTVDLIVVEENEDPVDKPYITLIDWKSNTNFTKNYDNQNGKEPISHLPNTKLSKYTLQLSMYAYMLEQQGEAYVKELLLVELGDEKVKVHKVDYLKKEVEDMIKW